MLRF
ncbi:hypothetical protein E2320_000980, partial [Naja naja]|jgi:hypothetical protein